MTFSEFCLWPGRLSLRQIQILVRRNRARRVVGPHCGWWLAERPIPRKQYHTSMSSGTLPLSTYHRAAALGEGTYGSVVVVYNDDGEEFALKLF